MEKIIDSFGEADTYALAESLAQNAEKGAVFALIGDLGVGKPGGSA